MVRVAGLMSILAAGLILPGCSSSNEDPPRTPFAEDRGAPNDPKDPTKIKFAEDRLPRPGAAKDPNPTPFDGERGIKYLKQLCDIGTRISGSDGMKKQQEFLIKHFEGLGGTVTKQEFQAKQTSRRDKVDMTNLIVSWFPDRKSRIILCCHYDTRPSADQEADPRRWGKPFISANDGTSGVAFMMELANHMKDFPTGVGVDFVFFDGEEYVFTGPAAGDDRYFFGSEYFASEYTAKKAKLPYTYTAAILFDLCMHDGARLAIEGHSWKGAKALVTDIWGIAETNGAKSFRFERGFGRADDVLDDHLALLNAGIPAIDIIDFDYKHWHLLSDTPDKCSAAQMTSVASVITTWLKSKK